MAILGQTLVYFYSMALAAVVFASLGCTRNEDPQGFSTPAPNAPKQAATAVSSPIVPSQADSSSADSMGVARGSAAGIAYELPENWEEVSPSSPMRQAQFKVAVDGGEALEIALFRFPGGGSVEANVTRWKGQFRNEAGTGEVETAKTETLSQGPLNVTILHVEGTYLEPQGPMMMGGETKPVPDSAMLAAVVLGEGDPWFLKVVGGKEAIQSLRPGFLQFTRSLRPVSEADADVGSGSSSHTEPVAEYGS